MAYLAFYRTFRPTAFDSVVRQEHVVKILKNQIETGKIGHAYLFCGPRGTGKTTLAKIFAKAINCEQPKDGSPCGECATCRALQNGATLDISEIDAASNNGVDEMRDLREKVQYPPVNGKYKVYIIDEVHMLTQSAFNAVLKTLEEPPAHAVFILATTEPQKIPATILSRCMRFDFKLIPQEDLEGLIKSVFDRTGKEYEEEAIAAIARAGNGSARDCLSIADTCSSYSSGKLTYDDVNAVLGKADFYAVADVAEAIVTGDAGLTLELTEGVLSTGKGVGVLIRDLLSYMNNLAVVKTCKNAERIVNLPKDKFEKLQQTAQKAGGHTVLRVTEILAKAEGDLRYAVDGRITLEAALIKAAMPEAEYDLGALLSRIEKLERQVAEGVKVTVTERKAAATAQPAQQSAAGAQPDKRAGVTAQYAQKAAGAPADDGYSFDDVPLPEPPPAEDEYSAPVFENGGRRSAQDAKQDRVKKAERPAALSEYDEASPFGSSGGNAASGADNGGAKPDDYQQTLFNQSEVPSPKSVGSLSSADKSTLFGRFIKLFRTTRRNAVLFTLCMDLESTFEGDTFILMTTVEAVYKSLNREDNRQYIAEALAELGVFSFDIRLKPKGEDKYEKAIGQLRSNFGGTDITIK